jgi:hypothetical protein
MNPFLYSLKFLKHHFEFMNCWPKSLCSARTKDHFENVSAEALLGKNCIISTRNWIQNISHYHLVQKKTLIVLRILNQKDTRSCKKKPLFWPTLKWHHHVTASTTLNESTTHHLTIFNVDTYDRWDYQPAQFKLFEKWNLVCTSHLKFRAT